MTVISAADMPSAYRARRLLVRMNQTLFYCLGAAVLLEAAAERAQARQAGTVPSTVRPCRAQWLRNYAAAVWPEFGWEAACDAMDAGQGLCWDEPPSESAWAAASAHHMALFYGALSRIAEDPALRRVLEDYALADHARCDGMAVGTMRSPWAAFRAARLMHGYVRHLRDRVVRRAFEVLQQHWSDAPPFPEVDYDGFLLRARALLAPHVRLSWPQRMVYRGWLKPASGRERPGAATAHGASQARSAKSTPGGAPRRAIGLPRAAALR